MGIELQKVGPSTTDNMKFRGLVGLFKVYVTSGSYIATFWTKIV